MDNQTAKYQASRARKYELDLARYYKIPAVQSSLNVVLSLFVVAFFIMFALRPTFVTITKLQNTIAQSKKTLTALDTKVAALQRVSIVWEDLKDSLPMIDASIPVKGAEYAPLVSTLELLAHESGVVLETASLGETLLYSRILSPFTVNKDNGIASLPFTARVVGPYASLTQFLDAITQVDRIITLESLTYSQEGVKGSDEDGSLNTSLTITGEAYYVADLAQLEKVLPKKGGQ